MTGVGAVIDIQTGVAKAFIRGTFILAFLEWAVSNSSYWQIDVFIKSRGAGGAREFQWMANWIPQASDHNWSTDYLSTKFRPTVLDNRVDNCRTEKIKSNLFALNLKEEFKVYRWGREKEKGFKYFYRTVSRAIFVHYFCE